MKNRIIAILVIASFLFQPAADAGMAAINARSATLAPPSIFAVSSPDEYSHEFRQSLLSDIRVLTVSFSICGHLLAERNSIETLSRTIRDEFRNSTTFLEGVDLENVSLGDDIVVIPYKRDGVDYYIRVGTRQSVEKLDNSDSHWALSAHWGIQITKKDSTDKDDGAKYSYKKTVVLDSGAAYGTSGKYMYTATVSVRRVTGEVCMGYYGDADEVSSCFPRDTGMLLAAVDMLRREGYIVESRRGRYYVKGYSGVPQIQTYPMEGTFPAGGNERAPYFDEEPPIVLMGERPYNNPNTSTDEALKGSLKECLKTLYYQCRDESVTVKHLTKLRIKDRRTGKHYSRSTVFKELTCLEKFNLVERDTSSKAHTFRLAKDVNDMPPADFENMLSGFPDLDGADLPRIGFGYVYHQIHLFIMKARLSRNKPLAKPVLFKAPVFDDEEPVRLMGEYSQRNKLLSSLQSRVKNGGPAITMLTAYDTQSAAALCRAGVDMILVGDSVSMVKYGFPSTQFATMDMMIKHTKLVAAGRTGYSRTLIIGDMPYRTYDTPSEAITNARRLIEAGADAVKLEGGVEKKEIVKALVASGIPVMGHIGLMPQSKGTKVYGRTRTEIIGLLEDALSLEEAGAFSIVMEMVYAESAELVTRYTAIPTIGIGSGPATTGQVLVLDDIIGLSPIPYVVPKEAEASLKEKPVFVKRFSKKSEDPEKPETIMKSARRFIRQVIRHSYPKPWHYYQSTQVGIIVSEIAREIKANISSDAGPSDIINALKAFRRNEDIKVAVRCYPVLPITPRDSGTEKIYTGSEPEAAMIKLPSTSFSLSDAIKAAADSIIGKWIMNLYGTKLIPVVEQKSGTGTDQKRTSIRIGSGEHSVSYSPGETPSLSEVRPTHIETIAKHPDLEVQRIGIKGQHYREDFTGQSYHIIYLAEGAASIVSEDGKEVLGSLDKNNPCAVVASGTGRYSIKATNDAWLLKTFVPFESKMKIEEDIKNIHRLNIESIPSLEKNKTLWHVIPLSLVPQNAGYNQRNKFIEFVHRINRLYPDIPEKIKIVTEEQDIAAVVAELKADKNAIVDVALDNEADLERIPQNVDVLIFKPMDGIMGDFRQLEGIIASLRALHIKDAFQRRERLERLYGILTGRSPQKFPDAVDDPKEFARRFMFILPPITINNTNDLKLFNENMLRLMEAA